MPWSRYLSNHDQLRHDPMMAVLAGKLCPAFCTAAMARRTLDSVKATGFVTTVRFTSGKSAYRFNEHLAEDGPTVLAHAVPSWRRGHRVKEGR
jgi:hypothetical protein